MGLNRTFMELKFYNTIHRIRLLMFKSHLYGIEISVTKEWGVRG